MFLNRFKQVLNDNIPDDGRDWTIIDVFGGSGLLSRVAKQIKPQARVIYNDFDGYAERLKHINDINRLRQQLFNLLDGSTPKNKALKKALKSKVINVIQSFDGFIDLNCLSSWLLFSGQQVGSLETLFNQRFWHCVRQTDYPEATGYLDDLEVICESFHQLIPKFKDKDKVLLVLDPPYLCTRQESYKQERYFDLVDFLRLVDLTRPHYLFFSSTKSEFIRFINYLVEDKVKNWQVFDGAKRIAINTSASYNGKYEGNLVYKF